MVLMMVELIVVTFVVMKIVGMIKVVMMMLW